MSGTHDMAPAGHDTHLYDPNTNDNQIVALYETDEKARAARDQLIAAGVDSSAVQVMDRAADKMAGGVDYEAGNQGLWGSIKSLFMPDEDAHAYNHAVSRGHAMVVVTPAKTANRSQIIDVLESTDPIDFDAKLEEWRQSGYDYSGSGSSLHTETATGAATGTGTAMGAVSNAASSVGSGVAAAAGSVKDAVTPGPATKGVTASTNMAAEADNETIKVMEERLRVGKREVAKGAVRVRSYVVERPVEEQVRLHEERIQIERRPVDRAVTDADTAFQERTVEARATSEEAVVSKEARVVEEIGLHKDVSERTETVRDTVRKTEVDVENTTTSNTSVTGAAASNSTPGATSSGMNTPRK